MQRWYVGRTPSGVRQIFKSDTTPTHATHGHLYTSVLGPFRTKRGAMFDIAVGTANNPHIRSVADAERIAKKEISEN